MLRSLLATVSAVVSAVGRAVSYVSRSRIVRVAGKGLMKAAYKIEQFWELAVLPTIGEVAALPLQAAGAGAQRCDGERRGVVDIQRQGGETLAGEGQFLEFLAADMAHAERLGADARLLGENAGGQLGGAHVEREEGHWRADGLIGGDAVLGGVGEEAFGGVEGDVGDQRGFAHGWAGGEDDEVRIVQAADFGVEAGEAGGLARDVAARI